MKIVSYIIFFTVFFSIYGLVNYYIFIRGWHLLPRGSSARTLYMVLFIVAASSFIVGRVFEKVSICPFSSVCIWIGSFWFAFMLYFFIAALFVDIIRVSNHYIGYLPDFITSSYTRAGQIIALVVIAASTITVAAGYFNARDVRVTELDLSIPKQGGNPGELNITAVSDIHLGIIISNSRLEQLVNMINGTNPDIVLLVGDIVDEDLAPVIENNLGETLCEIRSRYGTYAVTGNHEYIGGVEPAVAYMRDHGITVLRDQVVNIEDYFYLVGREDRSLNAYSGKKRKSISEIIEGIDKSMPIIVMDHQPFGLADAAAAGIDLQLSGHTHNGQLWPLNYVIDLIYELGSGYRKIGNTHFYVSKGSGTWGPPVRVGNRPEIVRIHINFRR